MLNAVVVCGLAIAVALAAGCGGTDSGKTGDAAEADITKASCIKIGDRCLKNGMNVLPDRDAPTFKFPAGKCFQWNRGVELIRGEGPASRVSAEDGNEEFKALFRKISAEQNKFKDGTLDLWQVRLTAKYFHVDGAETMTAAQLKDEAEDPIISHWELIGTDFKFTQINIATGDTPRDVVFKEDTLEPVAAASDDNNTFCVAPLLGK